MKIALIGTTLFHQGAEYVLATLARGLAARGHDVTVILSKCHQDWQNAHPDWKPFELPKSIKVVIQEKRRARESVFSLRRLIRESAPDVVMCHSGSYTYPLVIATRFMKNRPILIHVEHGGGVGTDAEGHLVEPRFSIGGWIKTRLRNRVDAQFAVSEGTAEAITRMTGYPRDRIYCVYNPVLDDLFAKKRDAISSDPLGDSSIPVVMAAGAFCDCKNYSLLLRAFATVLKRRPARLIIYGDGPLRAEYEHLIDELKITDSVSLPGFTDNLPSELKRAACFVVSSKIESFSIVLVEALACGVPVVSTDCPYGPREILKSGKYGILVPNGDIDALASGILSVLEGRGVPPTSDMVAPFSVGAIIDRYECLMQKILYQKGR